MGHFRYRQDELMLEDARRSPYFLWWSCLRRSKDYWWICQRRYALNDQWLRKMHSDFGDVYGMTFEQWWKRRGVKLFSEQLALPSVRQLDPINLKLTRGHNSHLLLEVPLNLTERTIIKQVRELLRQQPEREVRRKSSAIRPLAKFIGLKLDVLQIAMQVWQMDYESRDPTRTYKIGQVHGEKSLYQIGKELRLVKTCMPAITDNAERAAKRVNGMKVATSRMLSRANNLIDNAVLGIFPSIQRPKEPICWSQTQKTEIDSAVRDGHWRPLFDENETLSIP